ncbi:MAG: hypothetical protein HYV95_16390 [Opitutae bacterium]|nr:hypothetical protein [Opitutae bacterium]
MKTLLSLLLAVLCLAALAPGRSQAQPARTTGTEADARAVQRAMLVASLDKGTTEERLQAQARAIKSLFEEVDRLSEETARLRAALPGPSRGQ